MAFSSVTSKYLNSFDSKYAFRITIKEYFEPPLNDRGGKAGQKPGVEFVKQVILPLPVIDEKMSVQYSDADRGGGTAAGSNMIINMLKGLFDGIGAFDTVKNSRAQQGQMIVPSTIQRFEAAPPREFSFSWNIFPRNKEEALEVADIIHTLRIYSLPGHFKNATSSSEELSSTGKKLGDEIIENISNLEFSKGIEDALLTLSSLGEIVTLPHIFFLDIMNLESDSPFAKVLIFKPCFLTDLSVTYGGNDEYIHYADGTPVEMTLNVSFKEMIDLRREDFLIEQTEKSTKNTAY